MKPTAKDIDSYIAGFSKEVQVLLEQVRATIRQTAPAAVETIKYGMPTFVLNGNIAHFAAFKNHIGFYPAPTGVAAFEKDLEGYKVGKGSLQLPLSQPMPLELIARIVRYNMEKVLAKKQA